MISTTNYNSKKMKEAVLEGRKIYGCSRWPYRWIKGDTISGYILELAPSEKILDADDWDWDVFKKQYLKELKKNKNAVIEKLKQLDEENSVLCCFEKDVYTCHRSLIPQFAEEQKLNITIKEL